MRDVVWVNGFLGTRLFPSKYVARVAEEREKNKDSSRKAHKEFQSPASCRARKANKQIQLT